MHSESPPPALRKAIAADLRRVRPLPPPSRRALAAAPLGVLLPLLLPALGHLPPRLRTWSPLFAALFAAECLVAIGVTVLALREVIPGRAATSRGRVAVLAGALATPVCLALVAMLVAPSRLPDRLWHALTVRCLATSAASAVPVLVLLFVLAWRGLVRHPVRVGTLLGLAAGLLADAGRRGYCPVSQPSHVLVGHLAAIVAVAAAGALTGVALGRLHEGSRCRATRSS